MQRQEKILILLKEGIQKNYDGKMKITAYLSNSGIIFIQIAFIAITS